MPRLVNGRLQGTLVKSHELDSNLFEPHVITSMQIRTPDLSGCTRNGAEFRYITTDRMVLNRMLRQQAADAGARFKHGCRVKNLLGRREGPLEEISIGGMVVTDDTTGKSAEPFPATAAETAAVRERFDTGHGYVLCSIT